MEFQKIALFRNVSEYDCNRMYDCFHAVQRQFHIGDIVCDYETTNGHLGIVLQGDVSLIRVDENGTRTILEQISENGIFGECLAFAQNPEAVSVLADSDCLVVFIAYDQISKRCSNACACHTQITENLFRLISEKSLGLSERVEVLSRRSIRERLLCYFHLCAFRAQTATFTLPFSGTTLADYLCVDRSAMLRELKKMKADELISVERRKVTVHMQP